MSRKKLLAICVASAVSSMANAQPAPEIQEISVIGQFVPDEKRATDQISNVIGEEQFTRSGDANIAEGLKRISGLSTVGGKYVYVRGLGERYSTTLLNGAILPSPEPINRVVPMDLFPTAILDSVLVQKTYSAQYPSEFGGGVLQMRTKKSTDEFFWNVTSSLGMVQGSTFEKGFTMKGGGTDWLGMDDGYRELPTVISAAAGDGVRVRPYSRFTGEGFTDEQLQAFGRAFRNEYQPTQEDMPPNFDFSTSLGNYHDLGDSGMRVNYLAAVDYSNGWDTNTITRNLWVPGVDELRQQEGLTFVGTEHSIDLSGIATAGLDFNPNHNLRMTSVLLRKTDDRVSRTTGFTSDVPDGDATEIEWIERELLSNQLQGDHYFPDFNELAVNWRYSQMTAQRESPDNREYRYDGGQLTSRADSNLRRFSTLEDTVDDIGVDMSMVFYAPMNAIITPRVGYVWNEKDRDSQIRRFGFTFAGSIANDPDLLKLPLEQILSYDNISPNGFELLEITRPTDSYRAASSLEAYYAEVEVNFDDRFRFTFGGRQEDFSQKTTTFDLFRPELEVVADLQQSEFLPALSATYIYHDHQFRLAYSETVSRPDFRELSTSAFTNPITGRSIIGNPDLQITDIKNYDFRWEWYFAFSDYMSLGLFFKDFTNPIESSIFSATTRASTYINAASAQNQGVEYEIYKRMDFLGNEFLGGIGEDFYVQANVAYIDSNVEIAPEDQGVLTTLSRPLQGQSDLLFNLQVGYEPFSGTTATLLYHYYGDRIGEVGIEGAPDLIEQDYGELNFVLIKELSDNWRITAKAKNILDEDKEITQGGRIANAYNEGREFSFQVDYNF
ncbi:MAG: TonB-dependent receptor [Gammaproteobacteria bacterium]|nr:TonB-dependent receptor [Pseudomonadales bacterium]MCP5346452.1 TonB-dependent receptor [Pseudomonadales bacterium]